MDRLGVQDAAECQRRAGEGQCTCFPQWLDRVWIRRSEVCLVSSRTLFRLECIPTHTTTCESIAFSRISQTVPTMWTHAVQHLQCCCTCLVAFRQLSDVLAPVSHAGAKPMHQQDRLPATGGSIVDGMAAPRPLVQ